jgi:hypothetical protein
MKPVAVKPLDLRLDPRVRQADVRRGHRFQPPKAELAKIPRLYATEQVDTADQIVHLHYFVGACDWYITEIDPETFQAFGFANLGDDRCAEWGYIDLIELAVSTVATAIGPNGATFRQPVERDLYFDPKPFGEVIR